MSIRHALLAATMAAGTIAGTPASAYQIIQSYTVASPYDLHHGITYNTYPNGDGFTNSFNLAAPGGVITDGFPKDSNNPPLLTYLMATSNLFDPTPTPTGLDGHLVIGFNDAFAGQLLLQNEDFTTTFTGYDEDTLIRALTLLDTSDLAADDPDRSAQITAKNQAVGLIFGFSEEVGSLGGLMNANGGSLTLLSFSTPAPAGTGTSELTPVPGSGAVPEPITWAMMVGGFGVVGASLRGRRRVAVTYG